MAMEYSDRQPAFYVDLPSIAAGTLLALAISIVLLQFGAAIGLAITEDIAWEEDNAAVRAIVMGLWMLWVQILASLAGGYIAGRLRQPAAGSRPHEREMRDGAHGLLVWATGTVAVAIGLSLATALAATVEPAQIPEADLQDIERNAAIILAFSAAATSLVASVAAWWAATKGGEHRDENKDFIGFSFRKK